LIEEKETKIKYYPTEKQVVNIFTKPLKIELFYKLKKIHYMIRV